MYIICTNISTLRNHDAKNSLLRNISCFCVISCVKKEKYFSARGAPVFPNVFLIIVTMLQYVQHEKMYSDVIHVSRVTTKVQLNQTSLVDDRRISSPLHRNEQSGNSFLPFIFNTHPPFSHLRQTRRLVSSLMTGPHVISSSAFSMVRQNYPVFPTTRSVIGPSSELTSVERPIDARLINCILQKFGKPD